MGLGICRPKAAPNDMSGSILQLLCTTCRPHGASQATLGVDLLLLGQATCGCSRQQASYQSCIATAAGSTSREGDGIHLANNTGAWPLKAARTRPQEACRAPHGPRLRPGDLPFTGTRNKHGHGGPCVDASIMLSWMITPETTRGIGSTRLLKIALHNLPHTYRSRHMK